MHNSFLQKNLTRAIFLLTPAANMLGFYWLHEIAACCYFGTDLGNGLDHNSPSRLKDGKPHSSSYLLYFTLLLPLIWTIYSKSNFLSVFCSRGQNYSQSNSCFLFFFGQNSSMSEFFLLLAFPETKKFQLQIYKNILSPIIFLSLKNFLFCLPISSSCRWRLNSVH